MAKVKDFNCAIKEFISEWNNEKTYIIAHTSGSTGSPKEIHLSKTIVKQSAWRTIDFFKLDATSRLHLCLSTDYIAGKMMVVRALLSKAVLTFEPPSNKILTKEKRSDGEKITLLAVVPSQLEELVANPSRLRNVQNILVGGGAIPTSIRKAVTELNISARESYGMTETASHVALRRITKNEDAPFIMLQGITCYAGADGNLCIRCGESDIATRDAAEILSPTSFILLGRLDDAIISGGLKIHPLQVEKQIEQLMSRFLPAVPYYISSATDPKWGERVVLILQSDNIPISSSALMRELKTVLPAYAVPKEIIARSHFEYTRTGKLIRSKPQHI